MMSYLQHETIHRFPLSTARSVVSKLRPDVLAPRSRATAPGILIGTRAAEVPTVTRGTTADRLVSVRRAGDEPKLYATDLQEVEADLKTTGAVWIREVLGQGGRKRYEEPSVPNECSIN
uniref:MOSC domain-containing protein n=1 Tax=Ascaris lumbricoides TaxID=6252 RepID=A0A0M3IEK7_ASCLU